MSAVAMQSFGFGDQLVRVVEREGSAWFVGNDVCGALELANSRQVISRLEEDERDCVHIMDAMGRERETTVVSESGVYALVFTSRKEAAKRFRRWVTQEVLPAIRTTGRYELAVADSDAVESLDEISEADEKFVQRRQKLGELKEIRLVFGARAARKAWLQSGLLAEGVGDTDVALQPIGVIRDLHQSVADWLEARTVAAPGHRMWAQELYDDYLVWGRSEGLVGSLLVSQTGFGRTLTQCGVAAGRSSRVYRIGLRLAG